MKVLLGIATYPTDPAIYPPTRASLDTLVVEGFDVTVVEYGEDDPTLRGAENLVNKHNRMRQDVVDGGYDALLTVEADMVIPSEGAGFGCTLIHRRVLERVSFRGDKRRKFADDWPFALDVKAAGFRSAHDLSVVCGHLLHESGVMWPDIDAPNLVRIEGTGVVHPDHRPLAETAIYRCRRVLMGDRVYRRGEVIELNAEAAAILLARGAIEMLKEA